MTSSSTQQYHHHQQQQQQQQCPEEHTYRKGDSVSSGSQDTFAPFFAQLANQKHQLTTNGLHFLPLPRRLPRSSTAVSTASVAANATARAAANDSAL